MEVLITSAKPTSMMFGKVFASCIVGFTQLVLVFGSALLFYNINKAQLQNPIIASIFDMPISLFIYMLVFFVLGFLIYAFLYGAIGSTASKLEDISTMVLPVTFLFIIAFMVVLFSMIGGNVNSVLMKVFSYIPFNYHLNRLYRRHRHSFRKDLPCRRSSLRHTAEILHCYENCTQKTVTAIKRATPV